jgi:four helix bundle protein
MSRDPWQLRVFCRADELVVRIYQVSKGFPSDERFGLQGQLRRAAISVSCNVVEGSGRSSPKDYLHFLNTAQGSAAEARYLIHLCGRLGMIDRADRDDIWKAYDDVCRGLQALVSSIRRMEEARRQTRSSKREG